MQMKTEKSSIWYQAKYHSWILNFRISTKLPKNYLKMTIIGKKSKIIKKNVNHENAIGMLIARLCYIDYLIGSSKINFEQEIWKSVLNGFDVDDINHSSELYSKFMPFRFFSSRLEHTWCKPPGIFGFGYRDEETKKIPDGKIYQQCLFCVHQFPYRLLGSAISISECNS